jgi:tetratricopeptide (TPR) repeat protein
MTDPAVVYERAHKALLAGDYPLAIKIYEALMARYPFAAETRQSRLDVIYCYYQAGESESAIDAADTFIRENPTIRASTTRGTSRADGFRAPAELHGTLVPRRPEPASATQARRSFAAFQTVVEQYPNSDYAHDARPPHGLPAQPPRGLRNRRGALLHRVAAPTWRPRSAPRSPSRTTTARPRCVKRSRSDPLLRQDGAHRARRADAHHVPRELRRRSGEAGRSSKKKWWKPWAS